MIEQSASDCQSLKQLRKRVQRRGLRDVAIQARLSITRLSDFEAGVRPGEEHIPALAAAYGVTVNEFWRLWRKEPAAQTSAPGAAEGGAR